MRTLVPLFLAACASDVTSLGSPAPAWDETVADGAFAARAALGLELVEGPYWGEDAMWRVSGAVAGETVHLLGSINGEGAGSCPALIGGQCLGILPRVIQLGTAVAAADGTADIVVAVPPQGVNETLDVSLQAAIIRGAGGALSVLSDPRTDTVRPPPIREDLDHVPAKVDLLLVVDNSCSMFDEQARMAAAFPTLLDAMAELDYHVGVVSTDMDNPADRGRLEIVAGEKWVGPTTPNAEDTLAQMASLGTSGSGAEKGLDAAHAALEVLAASDNAGFDRGDSQLAVVVLSDEEDGSSLTAGGFVGWFSLERAEPTELSFHSIVTPRAGCAGGSVPGERYLDVTETIGGVVGSICDADYAPTLLAVTDGLWSSQPISLLAIPDEATLEIEAEEPGNAPFLLADDDWDYSVPTNTIRIAPTYRPPAGTIFHVSYQPL